VQMAMFVVVPLWLVDLGGLNLPDHWKVYLPVVLGSFVIMAPIIMYAERRGMMKLAFVGSIALISLVEAGLALQPDGLMQMSLLLLLFFVGFNVLEASLPSLVSKLARPQAKGAALGVYNTVQALGLFVGAALGGGLYQRTGGHAVFWVCAVAMVLWCVVAISQKRWKAQST
jgi:predicted MFS family arabinose efflux permease